MILLQLKSNCYPWKGKLLGRTNRGNFYEGSPRSSILVSVCAPGRVVMASYGRVADTFDVHSSNEYYWSARKHVSLTFHNE